MTMSEDEFGEQAKELKKLLDMQRAGIDDQVAAVKADAESTFDLAAELESNVTTSLQEIRTQAANLMRATALDRYRAWAFYAVSIDYTRLNSFTIAMLADGKDPNKVNNAFNVASQEHNNVGTTLIAAATVEEMAELVTGWHAQVLKVMNMWEFT